MPLSLLGWSVQRNLAALDIGYTYGRQLMVDQSSGSATQSSPDLTDE
jgi:hypothetical protein